MLNAVLFLVYASRIVNSESILLKVAKLLHGCAYIYSVISLSLLVRDRYYLYPLNRNEQPNSR